MVVLLSTHIRRTAIVLITRDAILPEAETNIIHDLPNCFHVLPAPYVGDRGPTHVRLSDLVRAAQEAAAAAALPPGEAVIPPRASRRSFSFLGL